VLGLDGDYAKKYRSLYPVKKGVLEIPDSEIARYCPYAVGSEPVLLETILIPSYNPSGTTGIEKLAPGDVFTELLGYCFPPNTGDENLFDSVIKICEETQIFRLRTNSLQSMRKLLKELVGPNPELLNP
jgi:hypothetical protein